MRRAAVVLCCGLLSGLLTGCSPTFLPRSQDLSKVELMRTIAVDYAPDDEINVTVSGGNRQSANGEAGKPLVLEQRAKTLFAACQMIQKSGSGYVSYSHVTECVVGEGAAKAGIDQLLDYIQRDFEMRSDASLFVDDWETADELVRKTGNETMATTDRLQEINRKLPLKSESWPCTVRQFMVDHYDNRWAAIPAIKLNQDGKECSIESNGIALFQNTKMVKLLDSKTSRGACILTNKGEEGYVDVNLKGGGIAGLKITGETCRWKGQWQGDRLVELTADIQLRADLTEVNDKVNLQREDVLQEVEQRLSQTVTEEARAALQQERQLGDYLHLERQFIVQYPFKSGALRENWSQWIKAVPIRIQTRAVLERSDDVYRGLE